VKKVLQDFDKFAPIKIKDLDFSSIFEKKKKKKKKEKDSFLLMVDLKFCFPIIVSLFQNDTFFFVLDHILKASVIQHLLLSKKKTCFTSVPKILLLMFNTSCLKKHNKKHCFIKFSSLRTFNKFR